MGFATRTSSHKSVAMMGIDATVLVTGATGMVGSAVKCILHQRAFQRVLAPTRQELDLSGREVVDAYFTQYRPDYVFMIGAKVGGIAANVANPVGFLDENLRIQLNLFEACHKYKTRKSLFLGSSCVYPRESPQPMKEEYLLTGPLEPTNEGYAIAKIAGLKLAKYYHEQHGMLTICPMPCNIYGTNDHFELDRAHVLSALVRRFIDAKDKRLPSVTLWGTGFARREFIHVEDVAEALVFLMNESESSDPINLGTGKDISVRELAALVSKMVGYDGEISWDSSKPDGMPRKCLDISKLTKMGYEPRIGLEEGLQRTIREYRKLKLQVSPHE